MTDKKREKKGRIKWGKVYFKHTHALNTHVRAHIYSYIISTHTLMF